MISRVRIIIVKQFGLNKSVNMILVGYGRLQLRETCLSWEDIFYLTRQHLKLYLLACIVFKCVYIDGYLWTRCT